MILTADHDINSPDFKGRKALLPLRLCLDRISAIILPGCTIGKGAVVAAGSVVTKDVQPYTVVAGIPAKFLKMRSKDLKYQISYFRLFQ